MKKCIIFVRCSTPQQDLSQQRARVIEEAKRHGYTEKQQIVIEHSESAVCLNIDNRQGITELKQYIEKDSDIDCVFIYELSRLSRRPADLYTIRDYLIEHNINLISMTPSMVMLTPDGKLDSMATVVFGIFGSLAEQEGYIRKERMARGRAKAKSEGKIFCGSPLFGYVTDKKTQKAVLGKPEDVEVIRNIFYKYATGEMTSGEIAEYYFEQGTFPHIKSIDYMRSKIIYTLELEAYKGTDKYPAIVSEEIWNKAQARRSNNQWRFGERKRGEVKIAKKLMFDYETGFMFVPHGPNYTANMHTPNTTNFGKDTAHWALIQITKSYMNDYLRDMQRAMRTEDEHLNKVIHKIQADIEDEKQKLERLNDLYIDGKLTKKNFESKYSKVEIAIKGLTHKLRLTIDKKTPVANVFRDMKNDDIENMTPEQQKEIVNKIIEKILVQKIGYNDKILHVTLKNGITDRWLLNTNPSSKKVEKM